MGWVKHHAIIVTSWDGNLLARAQAKAVEVFAGVAPVAPICEPAINKVVSFVVFPDGSKEGWDESDRGDKARVVFKAWLNEQRYEDGSTSLSWVEVWYGSDDRDAEVEDHAWLHEPEEIE